MQARASLCFGLCLHLSLAPMYMKDQELRKFAENYSKSDFEQIKFDWKGKHGDDFRDPNMDFRMKLCELIKSDLSPYSDQLIIDLYLELSKSAKETFGVYLSYHLFANELLKRGGTKYFDIYLEGASQSMDTGLMSGRLDLSEKRIDEILAFIYEKLADTSVNARGYDYMQKRFEWLKKEKGTGANSTHM